MIPAGRSHQILLPTIESINADINILNNPPKSPSKIYEACIKKYKDSYFLGGKSRKTRRHNKKRRKITQKYKRIKSNKKRHTISKRARKINKRSKKH